MYNKVSSMSWVELIAWIKYKINLMVPGLQCEVAYDYNLTTMCMELSMWIGTSRAVITPIVRHITAREMTFTEEDFVRIVIFPMVMELTGGQ